MISSRTIRRGSPGFTLVEMLAAVAVLAVILVLLGQILQNVVSATSASKRNMDATRQARNVVDAIRDDLDALVWENGTSTVFAKAGGRNSELAFVTRRRTASGGSARFQAVAYRLEGTDLVRLSCPLDWSVTAQGERCLQEIQNADPSRKTVVAEGIVRFEVVALLRKDGPSVVAAQEPDIQGLGSASSTWKKAEWNTRNLPNGFLALDLPSVLALTVSVAAVDTQSLRLVDSSALASEFPTAPEGKTPQESWSGVLASGVLAERFPPPPVRSLRILQATLELP